MVRVEHRLGHECGCVFRHDILVICRHCVVGSLLDHVDVEHPVVVSNGVLLCIKAQILLVASLHAGTAVRGAIISCSHNTLIFLLPSGVDFNFVPDHFLQTISCNK